MATGFAAADLWAPPGAADAPFLLDWDEVVDEVTGNGDASDHRDAAGGPAPVIDGPGAPSTGNGPTANLLPSTLATSAPDGAVG